MNRPATGTSSVPTAVLVELNPIWTRGLTCRADAVTRERIERSRIVSVPMPRMHGDGDLHRRIGLARQRSPAAAA